MLGGGTWSSQNKLLPGTYINVSSAAASSASLSDRGYAAMPLALSWGPEKKMFTVTRDEFYKNCRALFGYSYSADEMLPLRELFQYTQTLYAYRLNSGGVKASNSYATAQYAGAVGNRLSVGVAINADDETMFDVSTYYDTTVIETQTVSGASELVDNDYVTFTSTAELAAMAKTPLTGGVDGAVTVESYQDFLDKAENYSYNVLGCPTDDTTVINLFINYTVRLRDNVGLKFQTVIYNPYGNTKLGDHEGIIEVGNKITDYDSSIVGLGAYGLVYWVTGIAAACAVNASNTNKTYDGELTVFTDYTQTELESSISGGWFMLHKVGDEVHVLEDIDSLTTLTEDKGAIFQSNQTIRVIDQIANDIATLFNTRYLGIIPNDADGRVSLWNDIVKIHEELETLRAIENFDSDSVEISQGETKKSVVCSISGLSIINAMSQLYMSVIIE